MVERLGMFCRPVKEGILPGALLVVSQVRGGAGGCG